MQALEILSYTLCNCLVAAFAVTAFFRLRDLRRRIDSIHSTQRMLFAISMEVHITEHRQQVERLKQQLQEMVANDRFEEAEQLKEIIAERMQYIAEQVSFVRTEFGKECEVKMYRIHSVNEKGGDV